MGDRVDEWRQWSERLGGDASGAGAAQVDAFLQQLTGSSELPEVLHAYRAAKWHGDYDAAAALRFGDATGDEIPAAVCGLVGMELLEAAIDCYIAFRPGANLARAVLDLLRPEGLWAYCLEILRTSSDHHVRGYCVDVMRAVAGRRALPDIKGLLSDESANVQSWAASMVFDMLWKREWCWQEVRTLVDDMDGHENEIVRREAVAIRERFAPGSVLAG
jgi:hypothetical protein